MRDTTPGRPRVFAELIALGLRLISSALEWLDPGGCPSYLSEMSDAPDIGCTEKENSALTKAPGVIESGTYVQGVARSPVR